MEFSISKMKDSIREESNLRVSKKSAVKLGEILEDRGLEISEKAVQHAEEDGRVTVQRQDIEKALEDLR